MRKRILLCMLLAFCHIMSMADENPTLLVFEDIEGWYWKFYLNECPKLTINDDKVYLTSKNWSFSNFPNISYFRRITYENEIESSKIINLQTDEQTFRLEYDSMVFNFKGLNNHFAIYSISGMLILDKKVSEAGEYYFPLSELSKGIYVVKINDKTHKITIK